MNRKFASLSLAALGLFFACKKSDSNPTPKPSGTAAADSTALLGKWIMTYESGAIYNNGVLIDSGHTDVNGADYATFDADGKFISYENDANNNFQPAFDTTYYKVINGHFLLVGADPSTLSDSVTILTLTADSLTIASKFVGDNNPTSGTPNIELDTLRYKR